VRITLIAAMAENRAIGRAGVIPWQIPADLARFREITTGHPLVMGRKTCESIGRPLPGRTTVVLSRDPHYTAPGCLLAGSLEAALALAGDAPGGDEVFICGGGEVYRQALPLADRIFLTLVHRQVAGDAFFPEIPPEFIEISREELAGDPACSFICFERRDGR
jgi:dihydrofolate reductase